MDRPSVNLRAAALGALVFGTIIAACGGKTIYEPDGGGNGGEGGPVSSTSSGMVGAQPPPPPADAPAGDGPGHTFVFHKLWYGDTDRSGTPSAQAWKEYGYNLDGKISTKDATDLCQPFVGGSKSLVYPDGNAGIDNAFGKVLLALFSSFQADLSAQVNGDIMAGRYSYLIRVEALGAGASYGGLLARYYRGSSLDELPVFDGSDVWPVTAESLSSPPDLTSAHVQFPQSYVNGQTWVSGPPSAIHMTMVMDGFELALPLTNAVITMDLAPDRSGASNGIIAGVLEVEPLIHEFQKVAGSFSEALCEGTTFQSLADQLRQGADILSSCSSDTPASCQDPAMTCDAISVGIGFEARSAQLGEVAAPVPPQPDPCEP